MTQAATLAQVAQMCGAGSPCERPLDPIVAVCGAELSAGFSTVDSDSISTLIAVGALRLSTAPRDTKQFRVALKLKSISAKTDSSEIPAVTCNRKATRIKDNEPKTHERH